MTSVNILPVIIQLVGGAIGGNFVNAACSRIGLGCIMSSLTGMLGGEIGGRVLLSLTGSGAAGNTSDVQIFLASLLGGTAGGAVITALAGWIKEMLAKIF